MQNVGNEFSTYLHVTTFLKELGANFERCPRCTNCFPYISPGTSYLEQELQTFCKSYFPKLLENNYKIIKPYELDVYIPEIKLAIEFNGIYYHSVNYKPIGYHLMKTEMCETLGIRLIHIWEDDWINNKDIIKNKLIDIFTNNEYIDYSTKLDRCWYPLKQISGYKISTLPPEIIERNYPGTNQNFNVENCGYLIYEKIN